MQITFYGLESYTISKYTWKNGDSVDFDEKSGNKPILGYNYKFKKGCAKNIGYISKRVHFSLWK